MVISTTNEIQGKTLEVLGIASGSTVQTVNAIRDLGASFRTIVGGEAKKYTEMMENARGLATQRMLAMAANMGADAVVGVRYSSSSVMQGAAEVMAYGTAVKFV